MKILMRGYKHPFRRMRAEAVMDAEVLGKNSGNLMFIEATFRALSRPGTEIDVSDFLDLFGDVDRVNAEYDAVVLPFANAFRANYLETLESFTEFIRGLKIPVTILGIGAQSDLDYGLDDLREVNDAAKAFAAAVLDKSPTIGVRGEFSASYLRGLGFDAVEVIGCPSVFMAGSHLPQTRDTGPLGPESRIALSLTANARHPGLVQHHLERYPELVYIAQNQFDLRLMLWGVPIGIPDDDYPRTLDHPLFAEDRARFFLDASTWIEELGHVDFAFGTRIHGNVAALLAGTPAHVLAHDSRTRELAEYFEIPHTRVDKLPEGADAADLLAGSSYAALHAGYGDRFARFTDFMRSHGLEHALDDPRAKERIDRRLVKLNLPPAVHAANRADATVALRRTFWSHHARRRENADLERRVTELERLLAGTATTKADDVEARTDNSAPPAPPLMSRLRGPARTILSRARRRVGRLRERGQAPHPLAQPGLEDVITRVRSERLTFLKADALHDLADAVRRVEEAGLPGEIVEAGAALGGSSVVLGVAKAKARPLRVYDTFGLIPPPSEKDGDDVHERYQVIASGQAKGRRGERYYGYRENLLQEVRQSFRRFGVPPKEHRVSFVQGVYEETMTNIDFDVALVHVDCDWYSSVMTCLTQLEPHLVPGGRFIIDDYSDWSGCRTAVDEFFADRPGYCFEWHSRLHVVKDAA